VVWEGGAVRLLPIPIRQLQHPERVVREVDWKSLENTDNETAEVDFKASFDPAASQDWCELIKDIVAMANSGGGIVVLGVNDDGTPAAADLAPIHKLDPATIVDKIKKYTGQHYAGFSLRPGSRRGSPAIALAISGSPMPIVFTSPGTYDVGGGKQKTAFSQGTVYFRHGAKSEPGNSDDLRAVLERELDRVRSSWLDGIAKVVTAPVGATVSVVPDEVHLTGSESGAAVRLVNDDAAPAFKAMRTDLLYPYRQKELVKRVNGILGIPTITAHDVYCVRKAHGVDDQPNFFYKPQFSSPQYSDAFADWIVEQYRADAEFFQKAKDAAKKQSGT
jgi:hypothetical protein